MRQETFDVQTELTDSPSVTGDRVEKAVAAFDRWLEGQSSVVRFFVARIRKPLAKLVRQLAEALAA